MKDTMKRLYKLQLESAIVSLVAKGYGILQPEDVIDVLDKVRDDYYIDYYGENGSEEKVDA